MTALDFTPAPGAAPAAQRVRRHALIEARLMVRNGEQLLLAIAIPIGIVIIGRFVGGPFGELETLIPSVLGLAIWSSAFTSVAIATGFERRYGVLERLAATPLGRSGLLAGKAGAVIMIVVGQVVIISAVGLILGWRPRPTPLTVLIAVLIMVLAIATFSCLALLLAGRLRAEATLGLANLIYLIFAAGGGLVVAVDGYPSVVRPVLRLLPTGALGEGLRAAATGTVLWWPLLVLAVWLVISGLLARAAFRWTS